jgi:hypothetical protein
VVQAIFMNVRTFLPIRPAVAFGACLALLLSASVSDAATAKRKNPTSRLFVADLAGESSIDTGERIEPLSKKSAYAAEGTVIETKPNGNDSLVLSNGTAIYVASDTRFEVKKFLQEPFAPNRADLEVEPSISQTIIRIIRGSLGICTSKLVAGSSMVYHTPHATINVRGRKVMIETDESETRVSLLEGDVTVQGNDLTRSENLQPGQQAIIRKASPSSPTTVTVQPIPKELSAKLDDTVALACISRRTVYFDVAPGANGEPGEQLQAVEIVPTTPPTQFTVSPSRIGE